MSENEKGAIVQAFCSQVWWLVLLRGIASVFLGIMLIVQPGVTAIILVQFLGAYFIVDGLFAVINSLVGRKHMSGWGWGLAMGGLEILTGIFIFGHPVISTIITASVLVYYVAGLAILFGVLGIVTGIRVRKEIEGEWSMIAGGILAIIFGLILIMNPGATAIVYLIVMGVMALIGGVVQIIVSFKIRQIGKKGIEAVG